MNSKKKGNAWENEIAKQIRTKFVPGSFDDKTAHSLVHRTPMSGGHVEKGDLIIKPPIWRYFPWFIECRNRESWSWKNVMEQGKASVIGKWFLEDAEEKCHPYDNNAEYPRYPMLLFTKKYQKVYFGALAEDLELLTLCPYNSLSETFNPCVFIELGKGYEKTLIFGSFDVLLNLYDVNEDKIAQEIDEYLGRE